MSANSCHNSIGRLYLCGQLAGWGSFLVLRLFVTASYCTKAPGTSALDACLLETASHLLGAAWSHLTWLWVNQRRLVDHGFRRVMIEGLIVANLGTIPLVLATWVPTTLVYADELTRFGPWVGLSVVIGQNTLITTLWFCSFAALLFFDRTRRLEVEHAQARTAAREAQLHALRGQINPHFLFNSFNSLRALIALDPSRATDSLTQLSALLRYSLTSAERMFVPLAEELQIVHRYLELEKLRLGDRLAITAELPADLEGVLVPPMLLQGLIENAVKFGPAARKAGGCLAYRIERAEARLLVRITNPGRLVPAASDSTAIGLRNLRDRLRLLYGAAATFSLREEPGERVVAELSLPTHPPESDRRVPAEPRPAPTCSLRALLHPAPAPAPVPLKP